MARLRYLPLLFSSHLLRFSSAAFRFPPWRVAQLFRLGRASAPSFLPGLLPSFPSFDVSFNGGPATLVLECGRYRRDTRLPGCTHSTLCILTPPLFFA
ncbi:hypothetical protein C8J57DRAFT_1299872 [Mycena rebaudengoi]|nr:hypothetical protein C8J57DRAFT_1299872 [Mycena rebaudengoi]